MKPQPPVVETLEIMFNSQDNENHLDVSSSCFCYCFGFRSEKFCPAIQRNHYRFNGEILRLVV